MRTKILCLSLLLVGIFLLDSVMGGLTVSMGRVDLGALEKKKVCGLCVYSTLPTKATFTVEYSDNLEKFVKKIYPNNFELEPIDCPPEPQERRECIQRECQNPDSKSAKVICTEFEGPFELSFSSKVQEHRGSVRAVVEVGAATIVEPLDFVVYYKPFNALVIVAALALVVAVAIAVLKWRGSLARKR